MTAISVALITGVIFVGCSNTEESAEIEHRVSIKARVLEQTDYDVTSTYTGALEGEKQAVLYARLSEAVDSVWVSEGDRVESEQVILSLDRMGPTSSYKAAEARYIEADKNFKRMEHLFQEGAISALEFDAAKANNDIAQTNYEAVTQLVEIRSPIGGTVTSVSVFPGKFLMLGQEVATVATTDKLRVLFGVSSDDISFFRVGDGVRIKSDASSETGSGIIVGVASSADPSSRTFEIEALIDNSRKVFSPGMFVQIEFIREHMESVIAVPRKSVLILDGKPTAFVVADGVAQKRSVTLGADVAGDVIIESGLNPGDTLVTLGQDYLEGKTKVDITELGH